MKRPQNISQLWAVVLPQWTPFYTWMPKARNKQKFDYKPSSTINQLMDLIKNGVNFFRNGWALRPCPWKPIVTLSLALKRQNWCIFRGQIAKTGTKWIPDDHQGPGIIFFSVVDLKTSCSKTQLLFGHCGIPHSFIFHILWPWCTHSRRFTNMLETGCTHSNLSASAVQISVLWRFFLHVHCSNGDLRKMEIKPCQHVWHYDRGVPKIHQFIITWNEPVTEQNQETTVPHRTQWREFLTIYTPDGLNPDAPWQYWFTKFTRSSWFICTETARPGLVSFQLDFRLLSHLEFNQPWWSGNLWMDQKSTITTKLPLSRMGPCPLFNEDLLKMWVNLSRINGFLRSAEGPHHWRRFALGSQHQNLMIPVHGNPETFGFRKM